MMNDEITPLELFERLKKEPFLLIDVRSEEEFASHHMADSLLHPLPSFDPKKIQTNLPVVFICRSGSRSKKATTLYLTEHPGHQAFNLTGGLLAWDAANLPMVTS